MVDFKLRNFSLIDVYQLNLRPHERTAFCSKVLHHIWLSHKSTYLHRGTDHICVVYKNVTKYNSFLQNVVQMFLVNFRMT